MGNQLAEWTVAVAAIIALTLTAVQLRQNGIHTRRGEGWRLWSEYLRLGLEYPWLGSTELFLRRIGHSDFAKLWAIPDGSLKVNEVELRERYAWFITSMLNAAEAIVTGPEPKQWAYTIKGQLVFHKTALKEIWGVDWKHGFDPKLDRLVQEVL